MRIRKIKEKILFPENSKGEKEPILQLIYEYKKEKVEVLIRKYNKENRKDLVKQAKGQVTKYFANKIVEEGIRKKEQ